MKSWVGIYIGREGKTECSLCGDECESVSHLLRVSVQHNSSARVSFMKKLQELLEDDYANLDSLVNVEKLSYFLGSELLESTYNKFDGLLSLVKEYVVDMWEIRKHNLINSILSLHQRICLWLKGRGMVYSIRMES